MATLDGLETARTLTRRYDGSPCHDRGPDIVAFAHQQGGSIDLHMSNDCALAISHVAIGFNEGGTKWNGNASATNGSLFAEVKSPQTGVMPAVAFQSSQSGVRLANTHATLDANNGPRRHNGALVGSAVRRLTPVECERLQGFPDDYTAIPWRGKTADQCPDGPRYKALGNSMAVPVMRWIGERIALVDAINLTNSREMAA